MGIVESISAMMITVSPVIGVFVPFVLSVAVLAAFVVIGIALWRK